MTVWTAVLATALGCYLCKLLGLSVPAGLLDRPAVRRFAELAPIALLAALTALQTFGQGTHGLTLDARALGLAAAGAALWRRAPFLVVVLLAVVVTALVRLL
ncbi:AzlD domain-containing protein [Streptacidiphilus sp. P02-A3a]|uniref:AzlD domain-containing protein n=1 Tax=Streptacidiphilus sp. P02-A3a TaxID=2704468 RepID=UPI0015F8BAFE|nr:AzlD domain-containing protein [Streptacidiphilus sp. P02-A3a]QMU72248.1 AzlD domain-containing protein [Streptacidiphilus sp. P02-A3a]